MDYYVRKLVSSLLLETKFFIQSTPAELRTPNVVRGYLRGSVLASPR